MSYCNCQFSIALSIAKDFAGKDEDLIGKIRTGSLMYCAVKECYDSLKYILEIVVVGELEKRYRTASSNLFFFMNINFLCFFSELWFLFLMEISNYSDLCQV